MPGTTETTLDHEKLAQEYAEIHLSVDPGVQYIYFLPKNAPPREIRLLEVNHMIAEIFPPEPVDFGVDISGANAHTLNVLDVTPTQWNAIQKSELPLPKGWSLEDMLEVGRR